MKKIDKIIIDADIARCVSEKDIPVSTNSRLLLNAMLRHKITFVRNNKLHQEWKEHASKYAKTWLVSMMSRRLIQNIDDEDSFFDLLSKVGLSEKEEIAGKKDCHLISAAKTSNSIIASNDVTAFSIFQKASTVNGSFGLLYWMSPTHNINEFNYVLDTNATVPKSWMINCNEHQCSVTKSQP